MEINDAKEQIQAEGIEALRKVNFYGGAILPTGAGKTKIMLGCLEEISALSDINSILYTCDNKNLRDKDFPAEVEKWGYGNYLPLMDRRCYKGAYKLVGEYYDVGLIDEGDFCITPEYIKLLLNNSFKYLIFVSATLTPEKLKRLKEIVPFIPIVYKKEMNEIEDAGVVNKSKYYYVNFLLSESENNRYLYFNKNISRISQESGFDDPEMELILRQRKLFLNRLKSSREVCKQLLSILEGRTLVFSELTDQIDKICAYTYHGGNENLEYLKLFHDGEIHTLGVVGKVNRGVNIHRVENVVLESCSSSKTRIVQKLGRGKRLGIEEFLNAYLLVPHYIDNKGKMKPTIVKTWLEKALKDFNISEIEVFKFYQK